MHNCLGDVSNYDSNKTAKNHMRNIERSAQWNFNRHGGIFGPYSNELTASNSIVGIGRSQRKLYLSQP
jgi:hypothetical protein